MLSRAWSWIIAALATAAAIAIVYVTGRRSGRAALREEQQDEADAIRRDWDAINSERPDLDRALDRLRKRASD